jgi:hypothetical protein
VKSSEAAESYGVSGENFGGYNHLCSTQKMGSRKFLKQARHLAMCRNILAQRIAACLRVPDFLLAELPDLQSRHADDEDSFENKRIGFRRNWRLQVKKLSSILSFTTSIILLSISGVLVNGTYENT